MKPTLVIMAAGIGSRYGGLKQIDPVGPSGEIVLDYSVYDAIQAGFGKVVFIIRPDIEEAFKEVIGTKLDGKIKVETVFQTLEKIYDGVSKVRKLFNVDLVGGDLAQGPTLELHVFGVGRVPKGKALLRSAARPGDILYVTGPLGNSFASGKHLTFMPRVKEGKWLRQSGFVRAMMDISDGLATDLRHILKASNVGSMLDGSLIPCNGTLEQALYDGEDFELLFTVRAEDADTFDFQCLETLEQSFPTIGKITDQPGILTLDGAVLERKAFEHFK
jgi:thiamine monophosphate kinase